MADTTGTPDMPQWRWTWFEHFTADIDDAVSFYSDVLGWARLDAPRAELPYTVLADADGKRQCGVVNPPVSGVPPMWVGCFRVEDVDVFAAMVEGHGGEVLAPAFDVPGVGRVCPVTDPEGASFYLLQPADEGDRGSTGFYWMECMAKDTDAAVAFYAAVFGFETSSMELPDGDTYVVLHLDGVPTAGVMGLPTPVSRPAWLPHIAVPDVDAAAARAKAAGGKHPVGCLDMDGVGRFTTIYDRGGAALGLITPAAPVDAG